MLATLQLNIYFNGLLRLNANLESSKFLGYYNFTKWDKPEAVATITERRTKSFFYGKTLFIGLGFLKWSLWTTGSNLKEANLGSYTQSSRSTITSSLMNIPRPMAKWRSPTEHCSTSSRQSWKERRAFGWRSSQTSCGHTGRLREQRLFTHPSF